MSTSDQDQHSSMADPTDPRWSTATMNNDVHNNSGDPIDERTALLNGNQTQHKQNSTAEAELRTETEAHHQVHQSRIWRELALFTWAFLASAAIILLGVLWQHDRSPPPPAASNAPTLSSTSSSPSRGLYGLSRSRGGKAEDLLLPPQGKRNLIFMVSDGMGPSSLSLTRSWMDELDRREEVEDKSESYEHNQTQHLQSPLLIDTLQIGHSRTRSTSSLITDSAAGATAFSCGLKTYNGAIATLPGPDFLLCGSVMEAAHRAGYKTGLVVTTRVTDATPAVFVSHVRERSWEDEIALQMVGGEGLLGEGERVVDLVLGGGRCHFLPSGNDEGGCRGDGIDLLSRAEEDGWTVVTKKADFDELCIGGEDNCKDEAGYPQGLDKRNKKKKGSDDKNTTLPLPLLGLFAAHDIPYEIDRRFQNETYPSLEILTRKALSLLSAATANSSKGFFIMIEGSRIDHAGHSNDPVAQVHEVRAYDAAVRAVMEFIENQEELEEGGTPTLMISTSDHETGGLAVGRELVPRTAWFPGVLANATRSAHWTGRVWREYLSSSSPSPLPAHQERHIHEGKGEVFEPWSQEEQIHHEDYQDSEATSPSSTSQAHLKHLLATHLGIIDPSTTELTNLHSHPSHSTHLLADMVSRRSHTGWSTHGHTAADVNIYSSHPRDPAVLEWLGGGRENTEIGAFMRWWMGVEREVEEVTRELREKANSNGSSTWYI